MHQGQVGVADDAGAGQQRPGAMQARGPFYVDMRGAAVGSECPAREMVVVGTIVHEVDKGLPLSSRILPERKVACDGDVPGA